jgi:3-oxoadipate enol-lactonase/4-carboxymuconolactone decarboxylase
MTATVQLGWTEDGPPSAPVLVLLNSIGTTGDMWSACVGPLAEQLRVIRIDARGHGTSPVSPVDTHCDLGDLATDVIGVLDQLDIRRAHLAGVSLGGMTAMQLAAFHPERVGRLALVCTSAWLPPAQGWRDRAAAIRTQGMAAVAAVPRNAWITPALAGRDPDLLTRLEAMLAGTDPESYAQCCEAIAAMDLRPDLARIAAPTLVIAGAEDPATPPHHAHDIAAAIPGARVQVLQPAAHLAPIEQPGAVTAALLGHLGGGATLSAGYTTRRAVLGEDHVDRSIANTTELTAPFQDFLTRYAWGDVWTRPGLGRRERSIATLAALVSLGAEHEIGMHVRAALRNGLTPEEVSEVLLHTAVYAGLPRANRAFAIAHDILDQPDT